MSVPTLVVSHPPHRDADAHRAASTLGLPALDVRLKANYPVPEIWVVDTSPQTAEAAGRSLQDAGLRVVVIPGRALAAIPPRQVVNTFTLSGKGLTLRSDSAEVLLPPGKRVIAVVFTPRPERGRTQLPPAFLDLYTLRGGTLWRWGFVQGVSTATGLGAREGPNFESDPVPFAGRVERFFAQGTLDRRLVNMHLRRREGMPPPGTVRRGYSFATAALDQVSASIEPSLLALDHQEFASRLVFLTRAAE